MHSKSDTSQLHLPHGTKKWKTEKVKTDMLRSIGKRYGESVQSVLKKKRKAAVGILQKRKVLNLG